MNRDFRVRAPKRAAEPRPPGGGAAPASKQAAPERPRPAKDAVHQPYSETPKEIGGPSGPEPTRYGDWERKGVCYDF